jgi:hypothetical protein
MSRRPAAFTEADFRRACRAAPDRTIEVRLPDGTIIRAVPPKPLGWPPATDNRPNIPNETFHIFDTGKGDEAAPDVAKPSPVRL